MIRVELSEDMEVKRQILDVIRYVAKTVDEFTAARVRYEHARLGLRDPRHPNVWGPMFRNACLSNIIEPTGRTVISAYPASSHARRVMIYRSLLRKSASEGQEA